MKLIAISDLHIGLEDCNAEALEAFLLEEASKADKVILCGDVFDMWIGDVFWQGQRVDVFYGHTQEFFFASAILVKFPHKTEHSIFTVAQDAVVRADVEKALCIAVDMGTPAHDGFTVFLGFLNDRLCLAVEKG